MGKTIYCSKIDWWVWLVTVGYLAVIWLSAIGMSWWYVVFVCGSMTLLYAWLVFGCWYEIQGASPDSFKVLRDGYAKDTWNTYYFGRKID